MLGRIAEALRSALDAFRAADAPRARAALHDLGAAFRALTEEANRFIGDLDEHVAGERLEEWAAKARTAGVPARSALRSGVPFKEIVAAATDERADLIVMGTHGRGGINRALLGSVADRVIRLAPCPVLTVREPS